MICCGRCCCGRFCCADDDDDAAVMLVTQPQLLASRTPKAAVESMILLSYINFKRFNSMLLNPLFFGFLLGSSGKEAECK